jgi:dephospho-CoA kinase
MYKTPFAHSKQMRKTSVQSSPLFVAITGDIGSGKSSVSKILVEYGFTVYSADEIGHKLLDERSIYYKLVKYFGNSIIKKNKIDRDQLGKIVFNDEEKLKYLNNIMHPKIIDEILKIRNLYNDEQITETHTGKDFDTDLIERKQIVFFEIPLLFEASLETCFDISILITADLENKLHRCLDRSNKSREEVLSILLKQMPQEEKQKLADIILVNDDTIDNLRNQINVLLQAFVVFIGNCDINHESFRGVTKDE